MPEKMNNPVLPDLKLRVNEDKCQATVFRMVAQNGKKKIRMRSISRVGLQEIISCGGHLETARHPEGKECTDHSEHYAQYVIVVII